MLAIPTLRATREAEGSSLCPFSAKKSRNDLRISDESINESFDKLRMLSLPKHDHNTTRRGSSQ